MSGGNSSSLVAGVFNFLVVIIKGALHIVHTVGIGQSFTEHNLAGIDVSRSVDITALVSDGGVASMAACSGCNKGSFLHAAKVMSMHRNTVIFFILGNGFYLLAQ